MKNICFYFQIHQPFRFRTYRFFDIGNDHYYYDDFSNRSIMQKIANNCYLPANKIILDTIKKHKKKFKVSYSISGMALEQFELYAPEVLESFKKLADTGCVEFLAETYSHSLVGLKANEEFEAQVKKHSQKIEQHFGQKPKTFRNTELIYSDFIGEKVYEMGFETMLTEGAKHILGWKSPNFVYCNANNPKLKLLLRNYKLSDDIAFRFSNTSWNEWPLTAEKYNGWLESIEDNEDVINLFMDYETFGEHQWEGSGIFNFLKSLPDTIIKSKKFKFATPSEIAKENDPVSVLHVPHAISWADEERDLTAWLGNNLQYQAFDNLYDLSEIVKNIDDEEIKQDWMRLQTSDHFYYMCTKFFSDGAVHMYFNPYNSPYEAFINYMNILSDFAERIKNAPKKTDSKMSKEDIELAIKHHQETLEKLLKEKSMSEEKVKPTKKSSKGNSKKEKSL
jgi:alpha-amylase